MKKALIIALVVVVLAIIVAYARKPGSQVSTSEQEQIPVTATANNPDSVLPGATESMAQPADAMMPSQTTPKLAYDEAVKRYGTQRIQFNAQCQATPTSNIYKAGLELMLDNRAGVERVIVFSGKTYRIPAYDYTVIKLTTPGITYIDCGSSQNVAKITVQ